MVHSRPALPQGHGEVLARPEVSAWRGIAQETSSRLGAESLKICGLTLGRLRSEARRQAVAEATAYTGSFGLDLGDTALNPELLWLTGHQPEIFHPGVWVKYFLLDALAAESGGLGIDLVVDTDTFSTVGLTAPCMSPEVRRCSAYLAVAESGSVFLTSPVPSLAAIEDFCDSGASMLSSLRAPALGRHFGVFCGHLRDQQAQASNLADLLTRVRRLYESPSGTRYLELPVSRMARSEPYLRFAAHLILDADRFAAVHNTELKSYRTATKTRSVVQPFPDLGVADGWIETPFWLVTNEAREAVSVRRDGDQIELRAGDKSILTAGASCDELMAALPDAALLAPRALTLTMYARLILGDTFIHGVGGGRYDSVTDAVIRGFFGIEPPPYVVASMTMYLPLGAHVVTDQEVADVRGRLHRLEHNPDDLLDEVDFDSAAERDRAAHLAAEKTRLVGQIKGPDADKKTIGLAIRAVNAELAELLSPLAQELRSELAQLEGQLAASEVLTDRTYPYCLWSPLEVQDKVR